MVSDPTGRLKHGPVQTPTAAMDLGVTPTRRGPRILENGKTQSAADG
jgi:hypothetical protein